MQSLNATIPFIKLRINCNDLELLNRVGSDLLTKSDDFMLY